MVMQTNMPHYLLNKLLLTYTTQNPASQVLETPAALLTPQQLEAAGIPRGTITAVNVRATAACATGTAAGTNSCGASLCDGSHLLCTSFIYIPGSTCIACCLPTHCPASPHHRPLPSSQLQSVCPATAVQCVPLAPLARSQPVVLGRPASNAWVKATPPQRHPSARCARLGNTPTLQKLPASVMDCADYVSNTLPTAACFDSGNAAFSFG